MRVLLDVSHAGDGEYRVEIEIEIDGEAPRALPSYAMPDPARRDSELDAVVERVERDRLESGDMARLGRFLFDRLLGAERWEAIVGRARELRDPVVELALRWRSGELGLHRFCWEAMHDGHRFLADHDALSVSVTRVVLDAEEVECPSPIAAPAKILFAVGAPIWDRQIRPGAEVIGVLRGMEGAGSTVDSKIVDSITLEELGEACARFQPDIVHFVSHGRLEEGRGELQLAVEDDGEESGWVNGEKLLRAMGSGDALPSLVLLTGCESAAVGEHMDSLAAEMVKGGVPIAIGMAGKIADPVCRLFTRCFGTSLIEGDRLVEAMSHGRRAGLQKQRAAAADDRAWALPSIYLAPAVPAGHAPVEMPDSGLPSLIASYRLRRDPVFCDREELGHEFARLLDRDDDLEVLVAYAEGDEKLGKTRLQHEFSGRALRAGHVVVKLDDDADHSSLPRSSVPVAAALLEEIVKTRARFGVPQIFDSLLLAELSHAIGKTPQLDDPNPQVNLTRLDRFLGECKRASVDGDAMADVLGRALGADLDRLMADIRGLEDDRIAEDAAVVLILGGIGYWGGGTELLFERLTGDDGLGTAETPIVVFATCSFAEDAREGLETARDRSGGRYWESWIELTPFGADRDTLAYQWVLLHPWSPHRYADRVYAPNPEVGDSWQDAFREHFSGVPGDFENPDFYLIANVLEVSKAFVGASDEHILREYAKSR